MFDKLEPPAKEKRITITADTATAGLDMGYIAAVNTVRKVVVSARDCDIIFAFGPTAGVAATRTLSGTGDSDAGVFSLSDGESYAMDLNSTAQKFVSVMPVNLGDRGTAVIKSC